MAEMAQMTKKMAQMRDFIERLTSYVDLFRIGVAPDGQLT